MLQNQANSSTTYLRTRVGRVCVALQGRTVEELVERAEGALAESHFLEFRLDLLEEADGAGLTAAVGAIGEFLAAHREVAAIATCRRKAFGGGFTGSLAEELEVLEAATRVGFAILDLEVESAEECTPAQLDRLRGAGAALMLSFHDFAGAAEPQAAYARMARFSPDYQKIVNTARSLTDAMELLRWTSLRSGESEVVAIAMGEPGVLTRVLGLRAGAEFTFASAPNGAATASGQMTARTLKDLYHVEQLDSATRVYGVAGNPVSHSLSPLMQNTAFRRERINAVYLPLKTESMEDLLRLAQGLPLSGMSVTMPWKQKVLEHLANVDALTARLGACNTIRMGTDGKLYGFNTDVAGIVRPLEKRMQLKDRRVLVLGAGGAARAAVYGLVEKGARVKVWSRKEAAAIELAEAAGAGTVTEKQIRETEFDVLINATPCGMTGNAHLLPLPAGAWRARLVFDLVYNPMITPLMKEAKARGLVTITGVEMFVYQGARQFELWTGKAAPEAEMLRTVMFALQKAQGGAVARG